MNFCLRERLTGRQSILRGAAFQRGCGGAGRKGERRARTEGNADDKETGVEGLLGDDVLSDLSGAGSEPVDGHEATDEEEDGEEEEGVCEDGVHAQGGYHDGIVTTEMSRLLWSQQSTRRVTLAESAGERQRDGGRTLWLILAVASLRSCGLEMRW